MGHRHEIALACLLATAGCDAVLRFEKVSASDAPSPDAPVDAADVTAGLVAYYPFDSLGSACGASDATGDGYDGTCTQGSVHLVPGKHGMAYAFDNNASIRVQDAADFELDGFTVAGWIYLPSTAPTTPFSCPFTRPYAGSYIDHWSACVQSGMITFSVESTVLHVPALLPNEWHHIALTWKDTLGTAWLDGVMFDTQTGAMVGANQDPIVIGSDIDPAPDGVDNFFPGYIDELRLYSRPLLPDEIKTLAM